MDTVINIYEVVTGEKVATIKARRELARRIACNVYHGNKFSMDEDNGRLSEVRFKYDSENHT